MHIIQINASYKPAFVYGGPTMSVSKLSEELWKAGINTQVFTTTANGDSELPVIPGKKVSIDGVPVTYFSRISKGNSHFSPSLLVALWKQIRKINYQSSNSKNLTIIHLHTWWNFVSLGSCIVSLLLSQRVIISPRGTLSPYSFGNRKQLAKNIFHYLLGRALLQRCHFHVSTEKEKLDILNLLKPKSINVIPNYVNLGQIAYVNNQATFDRTFKLLFLSRIEEKKGLELLFRSLKILDIPWHLTLAGAGRVDYVNDLKHLSLELGISEKIDWIGHQSDYKKFELMSANNLFVLTSQDESFANVVIESLSVGTPVLVTHKVGLADYVSSNDFGWVCNPNSNEISRSISAAYYATFKREKIRVSSPLKIRDDYNESLLTKSSVDFYSHIINF